MSTYIGNDIYCDLIIPRKIPVKIVKETEHVLAYHHTRPYWPVHIVVTPKEHISSLLELEGEIINELLSVVKVVAGSVKSKLGYALNTTKIP
ncbi:MAG TPA: HIT domain-containing protein [Candidatus Saccharimonadales bacterium]